MSGNSKWSVTQSEIPRAGTRGMYDDILQEFVKTGYLSAKIEVNGRSASTVSAGLKDAIKSSGATGVDVITRSGAAYLKLA